MEKHFVPQGSRKRPTKTVNQEEGAEIRTFYEELCIRSQRKAEKKTNDTRKVRKLEVPIPPQQVTLTEEELKRKTPEFLRAAQDNDVKKLNELLDKGIGIDVQDDYGWTALMCAACAGNQEAIELLLLRGADASYRDSRGGTAETIATQMKHFKIASLLSDFREVRNSGRVEERSPQGDGNVTIATSFTFCETCGISYPDAREHLTSIPHVMQLGKNAAVAATSSSGVTVEAPAEKQVSHGAAYTIPASNVGYNIMLKSGWDPSQGLGPDGKGITHPVKTILKKDRLGIGVKRKRKETRKTTADVQTRRTSRSQNAREQRLEKAKEAAFRREFF